LEPTTRPKASVSVSAPASAGSEQIRVRDPFTVVIFGASGDLSKRKLIPALYHLHQGGFLPDQFKVVGFSRSPMSDEQFREVMIEALKEHADPNVTAEHPLVRALHYFAGNVDDPESFRGLRERVEALEKEASLPGHRLFYLSVAPEFFATIIKRLAEANLVNPPSAPTWSRVIIEKPFGRDLESALQLNREVTSVLDESRSTASITTSGKRPSRTSSRSASGIRSSSRSSTRSTSTTCRSPWPRRSAWKGGEAVITKPPARSATWCRTT
jgi:hypothetical protein